ncbi:unnamed protein product [Rotaria sordida]|uniref:Uncharacterized protein n=1 Tax=Rotaria sordida TaxID=392033 RepID=A0A814GRP7_9BILA|nr:unnamed protein product [Rotaria sordida]
MKRITQILASIVFVITVVTVYLAFDFAINNAMSNKVSSNKRSHLEHDHQNEHNHPHDDIKTTKKRSTLSSILSHTKKSNRTIIHHNENEHHNINNERQARNLKRKTLSPTLHAKPGNFHKSRTGVKVNKPRKIVKEERKRLSTTTAAVRHKDKH